MLGNNYDKTNVNLDFDFSVSRSGYRLRPHRDDVTRLYNFLIYLNDIPKKNGGALTIFKVRSNSEFKKTFKRFPKISQLTKVNQFIPSRGSVIFFNQHQIHTMEFLCLRKITKKKIFHLWELCIK